MLSISAICASRSAPTRRPEDDGPEGVAGILEAVTPEPAGDGVGGTTAAAVLEDWTGAAGGAEVDATTGVGVEGVLGVETAGAAFGYRMD
jgi:hypothetical protein